jgi:hypothetical protein
MLPASGRVTVKPSGSEQRGPPGVRVLQYRNCRGRCVCTDVLPVLAAVIERGQVGNRVPVTLLGATGVTSRVNKRRAHDDINIPSWPMS